MFMTFLTVYGLVFLAMLLVVAMGAVVAHAANSPMSFWDWYCMNELLKGLFQLLGLVLMALVQTVGEASKS